MKIQVHDGVQPLSRTAGEGGRRVSGGRVRVFPPIDTLTRLRASPSATLSRSAGEGPFAVP